MQPLRILGAAKRDQIGRGRNFRSTPDSHVSAGIDFLQTYATGQRPSVQPNSDPPYLPTNEAYMG